MRLYKVLKPILLKNRVVLCFFISLFIFSCSNNKDPFKDVELGNVSKKKFIKKMKTNYQFEKSKKTLDLRKDTLIFDFSFRDEQGDLPLIVKINPKYGLGNLRKIEIQFNNLDILNFDENDSIKLSNAKRIMELYRSWYGIPDTIIKKIDIVYPQQKINKRFLTWETNNGSITIEDITFASTIYDIVTYEMIGYEKEIERIKDSIIVNQFPDNLVEINQGPFVHWKDISKYKKEFVIDVHHYYRKDPFDHRAIIALRYDIIISDQFNKILYTVKDFTHELKFPITQYQTDYIYDGNQITTRMIYDIRDSNYKKLEQARKYRKQYKIRLKAIFKSIVMSDGSVVESNP
ncbi:hypothetical protein [Aquimarina algiphila]|uniref:hypothetical protein n=1 Tax=Aquimarina algiphila TaxID=2047982 RepID=UPI00233102FF|nr:hypothetical protein [Aquimarina algiphila]